MIEQHESFQNYYGIKSKKVFSLELTFVMKLNDFHPILPETRILGMVAQAVARLTTPPMVGVHASHRTPVPILTQP